MESRVILFILALFAPSQCLWSQCIARDIPDAAFKTNCVGRTSSEVACGSTALIRADLLEPVGLWSLRWLSARQFASGNGVRCVCSYFSACSSEDLANDMTSLGDGECGISKSMQETICFDKSNVGCNKQTVDFPISLIVFPWRVYSIGNYFYSRRFCLKWVRMGDSTWKSIR